MQVTVPALTGRVSIGVPFTVSTRAHRLYLAWLTKGLLALHLSSDVCFPNHPERVAGMLWVSVLQMKKLRFRQNLSARRSLSDK